MIIGENVIAASAIVTLAIGVGRNPWADDPTGGCTVILVGFLLFTGIDLDEADQPC